jgi:hypothetical protein
MWQYILLLVLDLRLYAGVPALQGTNTNIWHPLWSKPENSPDDATEKN